MREIGRIITTTAPQPGFIGEGHTAVVVVNPAEFSLNDPFIALMDDRVDIPAGAPAGGAHPHAGFETVTYVVEGKVHDRDEGTLETGDVLWMTAGSGVIHNEEMIPEGKTRILQLWLTLPHEHRWAKPRFEHVAGSTAPVRREPGVEVRVYSGASGTARSVTHNYVPVTLLDAAMEPGAGFRQELPSNYNAFVYVLEGDVSVGDQRTWVSARQVGWLDAPSVGADVAAFTAGAEGARFVLYAGERQNVPLVMHGPFVGESRADLMRISKDYMEGRMPKLSEVPKS